MAGAEPLQRRSRWPPPGPPHWNPEAAAPERLEEIHQYLRDLDARLRWRKLQFIPDHHLNIRALTEPGWRWGSSCSTTRRTQIRWFRASGTSLPSNPASDAGPLRLDTSGLVQLSAKVGPGLKSGRAGKIASVRGGNEDYSPSHRLNQGSPERSCPYQSLHIGR